MAKRSESKKWYSYLNPMRLLKPLLARFADEKVDEYVTVDNAKACVRDGVTRVIVYGATKVDDDKLRDICAGMTLLGNTLVDLAASVNPDGPGGRDVTVGEATAVFDALDQACDKIFTEDVAAAARAKLKAIIRSKLG